LLERPDCSGCEVIHQRRGTTPPCETCTPPLMEENVDAVTVYAAVQRQLIVSPMGEVLDINQLAVHEAMRLFGIQDQKDCFRKVLRLAALAKDKQQEHRG